MNRPRALFSSFRRLMDCESWAMVARALVFAAAVGVTGIVLTKLDGSAKGGIVVSVQRQLGVPVKFVGLGEGADDLAPFDPEGFVDAIVSA